MRQVFTIVIVVFVFASLIAIAFTISQVEDEKERLAEDLRYRSALLLEGLRETVEPNFINRSDDLIQNLVEKYTDRQRIAGVAVLDNNAEITAASSSLPKELPEAKVIASDVMDSDTANGDFVNNDGRKMYIYAEPLHATDAGVLGSILVVQNAAYLDTRLFEIWSGSLLRLFIQNLLFSAAIFLLFRWVFFSPIQKLVASLKLIRQNKQSPSSFPTTINPFFRPLLQEVTQIQQSLTQARLAASEEARLSLEKIDQPWTAERLKEFTKDLLKERTIVAVSNLEPYIHTKVGKKTTYHVPASGLITAIEPIMQSCGGVWIAQGSGDGDKMTVDSHDLVKVPPDDPKYNLKRVWLTPEEINGYSHGFCDGALYPLCHMAHTRPVFKEDEWEQYKKVNHKFAKAILSQIKNLDKPVIFIQDFHFTLVPKIIKRLRPDALLGLFWHIPWVSAESFSICPWKKEILDGMLGADLIGFHTQLHCNNFIETVSHELESLIDYEQSTIARENHISLIKPFPISIPYSQDTGLGDKNDGLASEEKNIREKLSIDSKFIGLGVDRLDYIKGIRDRLIGIEIFFENFPDFLGKMTFVQISAPSESKSKKYSEFEQIIISEVDRINSKFKQKKWKPIVLLLKHHSHKELLPYYKIADFCLVTSLHDGMNLVSKEFVASRSDEKGVLILSQFAGAAKELKDALIINPYNGKQTAQAIYTGLKMSPAEQSIRMRKMRTMVKNYNIYRWSAEFLKTLVSLE